MRDPDPGPSPRPAPFPPLTPAQVCGAVVEVCGAVVEVCGAVAEVCGAVVEVCGAVAEVCGAVADVCGAVADVCGAVADVCGAVAWRGIIPRMEAIRWFRTVVTKHYSDFGGRARPAEFWWYMLVFLVIDVVLALIQSPFHTKILTGLLGLGLFLPTVGLEVRRLHDIGKSGWWLLMAFVPFIGGILLIYWWAQAGTPGPNRFGADPCEGAPGAAARA